jgi:lipopolysaccharide export system protein LptA
MKQVILLLIFLLSFCAMGAETKASPKPEKGRRKETALEISADRLEWVMGADMASKFAKDKAEAKPGRQPEAGASARAKEDVARLDGNVVVQDETMVLTCDHMLVFFEPKKDEAGKAAKKGEDMGVRGIEADGKVRLVLKEKRQTVTGDHAMYDEEAGTVTLDGNCTILGEDGQVMRSNQVVFNRNAGTLTAARVSLTLPIRSKGGDGNGGFGIFEGLPGGKDKEPKGEEKPAGN